MLNILHIIFISFWYFSVNTSGLGPSISIPSSLFWCFASSQEFLPWSCSRRPVPATLPSHPFTHTQAQASGIRLHHVLQPVIYNSSSAQGTLLSSVMSHYSNSAFYLTLHIHHFHNSRHTDDELECLSPPPPSTPLL